MKLQWVRTLVVLTLGAAAFTPTLAHETDPLVYDQVDLSATAEREIPNDLLVAVLYVEQEAQRQNEVADRINSTMAWALGLAKPAAGIKTQTQQYNTYPVYANNSTTISGWRARQALRLESADAKAIGELIAALQERLAVESVGYSVSRDARKTAEESLTAEALAQFQARAQQIANALGRPAYRLVRLNVASSGNPGVPIAYRATMMADAAMKAAPAQLEAGEQTLSISVSGTIQLDTAR